MSLRDQAKADIQQITSNSDEWGIEISLTAPTSETCTIIGLHSKHHLATDTDGSKVNSKNASISISEQLLIDNEYPVRNNKGEVSLKKHKVLVKDSTGITKQYVINEWFPDETIGLIVCILEDFE